MKYYVRLLFIFQILITFPGLCQGSQTITVLTNTSPNLTITSGSDEKVYGTSASNQIILESGARAELLHFPGHNSISLQSSSELFTVFRSGVYVTFKGADETFLKIPATNDIQTIVFIDRTLTLNIHSNNVMLDDQIVGFEKAPISGTNTPDSSHDYYVDASAENDAGDGTTPATAKKTIAAGADLMNGNDTLHIAAGTYFPSTYIGWPNGGNTTISGESAESVIIDLSMLASHWIIASGSDDNGGTIENITVQNLAETNKYVCYVSGVNNFTVQDCKFKDNERVFDVLGGSDGFKFIRNESSGIRNSSWGFRVNNATNVEITYSIFRASQNDYSNSFSIYDVASTVSINNSIFTGALGTTIKLEDAATVAINNTIAHGNGIQNNDGGFNLAGSLTDVTVSNSILSTNIDYNIESDAITEGFEDRWAETGAGTRHGIISISVDDYGGWEYVQEIAAVVNPLGVNVNWFTTSEQFPTEPGVEDATVLWGDLKTFLDAGNDIGCHSHTHIADIGDETATWDVEVTNSKAIIEAYIRQIPGYETWELIAWGSPHNHGSEGLADRLKNDGYLYGRMNNVNAGNNYHLVDYSIFSTRPFGSHRVKTAEDESTLSENKIGILCSRLEEMGGTLDLLFHRYEAVDDPIPSDFATLVTLIQQHNIQIMTPRQIVAYLEENATYTDGDGSDVRYSLPFTEDNFDGRLREGAWAIDKGEWIQGINEEGELDFWGKSVQNLPNIGADEGTSL